MSKLTCLAAAMAVSLAVDSTAQSPSVGATPPVTEQSIAELFERYYQHRLKLYPIDATFFGDNRYNDQLPNELTDAVRAEQTAFFKENSAALAKIDPSKLSEEARMSYEVLKWECEIYLRKLEFSTHLLPIDQFNGLHLTIGQFAGGTSAQPFKTVRDYEVWLNRVDAFVGWCSTAKERMQEGVIKGYVLPKALVKKLVPQLADLAKPTVEENVFYGPVKRMPSDFSAADRERLTQAYTAMVRSKIVPAFETLHDYVAGDYLKAARDTSGISAIPNGKEYYQVLIRQFTTTDLGPEEIFQLGEREVARILIEMEKVKETVGFKGDMKAFFEHVRTSKELMPFKDPQQVIDNFNAIHARMKPYLKQLFNLTPKAAFEVRRTEAFREKSASAEYNSPSLDGTRPGIFYVPIPNIAEYNLVSDEDLFLHEAIPGHHYQISLQQENTALPKFRRTAWYPAYGEGWALYCESLGKELGLYTDPYQYFGMLSAEMHRAIRLVVDVGLHVKGWTREQAIQYSMEHEAEMESSVIAEIERYMANPGQALAYKIGQLKIRELRARSEKALGDRFDVRDFHDRVLETGAVPLKVLEQRIDRWIAAKQKE
jgi:uncharacterized protein (DUF885 family)